MPTPTAPITLTLSPTLTTSNPAPCPPAAIQHLHIDRPTESVSTVSSVESASSSHLRPHPCPGRPYSLSAPQARSSSSARRRRRRRASSAIGRRCRSPCLRLQRRRTRRRRSPRTSHLRSSEAFGRVSPPFHPVGIPIDVIFIFVMDRSTPTASLHHGSLAFPFDAYVQAAYERKTRLLGTSCLSAVTWLLYEHLAHPHALMCHMKTNLSSPPRSPVDAS